MIEQQEILAEIDRLQELTKRMWAERKKIQARRPVNMEKDRFISEQIKKVGDKIAALKKHLKPCLHCAFIGF